MSDNTEQKSTACPRALFTSVQGTYVIFALKLEIRYVDNADAQNTSSKQDHNDIHNGTFELVKK